MWIKLAGSVFILLLGFSVSDGQRTKTFSGNKRTQARTPTLEVVNLVPVMQRMRLREGRNVIYTMRTGEKIIATVHENAVVGYDAVNSRGESLPMTIVPDPIQEERAREMQERIERSAQRAAEYKHCLEVVGLDAFAPIQKGCWVVIEIADGTSHSFYVDCKKGI